MDVFVKEAVILGGGLAMAAAARALKAAGGNVDAVQISPGASSGFAGASGTRPSASAAWPGTSDRLRRFWVTNTMWRSDSWSMSFNSLFFFMLEYYST